MLTVAVICYGHTNTIRDFDEIIQYPIYKEALCNGMKKPSLKEPSDKPSMKIDELMKQLNSMKQSEEESSISETPASELAVNESSGSESTEKEVNESSGSESTEKEVNESSGSESTEKEVNEKKSKLYDVIFLTESSQLCRYHLKTLKSCEKPGCSVGYLKKIIDLLGSATRTLDICLYAFTCELLQKAVYAAKARGVNIRYMTNDSTITDKDIPVQSRGSIHSLMHHKFCIIDNRTLITGSANWTLSAFFGNSENIIITDDSEIIQKFQDEFTRLWDDCERESYRCFNNIPKNVRNFRNRHGHY